MRRWEYVAGLLSRFSLTDGVGAELGVRKAPFSSYLLKRFRNLEMLGVDLCAVRPPSDRLGYETYEEWDWEEIMAYQRRNLEGVEHRFQLLKMDTVEAAGYFDDAHFAFVFIDAEHTYEGVKGDIEAWRSKVKPGGLLIGHDYNPNVKDGRFAGLMRAVDELVPDRQLGADVTWWTRC